MAQKEDSISVEEIVQALDVLGKKRAGLRTLTVYLFFVVIFYVVLLWQKDPESVFEVSDVIKTSIDGLEWSHGNTWDVSEQAY